MVRATVALAMMFAWIVISNHCALTQLVAKSQPSCCHPAPAKDAMPMKCCKALHATVPDNAPTTDAAFHAELFVFACLSVFSPERALTVNAAMPSRPPDRPVGFPDLVLGESLRSHAPPFVS
jgi:hypothetical protein